MFLYIIYAFRSCSSTQKNTQWRLQCVTPLSDPCWCSPDAPWPWCAALQSNWFAYRWPCSPTYSAPSTLLRHCCCGCRRRLSMAAHHQCRQRPRQRTHCFGPVSPDVLKLATGNATVTASDADVGRANRCDAVATMARRVRRTNTKPLWWAPTPATMWTTSMTKMPACRWPATTTPTLWASLVVRLVATAAYWPAVLTTSGRSSSRAKCACSRCCCRRVGGDGCGCCDDDGPGRDCSCWGRSVPCRATASNSWDRRFADAIGTLTDGPRRITTRILLGTRIAGVVQGWVAIYIYLVALTAMAVTATDPSAGRNRCSPCDAAAAKSATVRGAGFRISPDDAISHVDSGTRPLWWEYDSEESAMRAAQQRTKSGRGTQRHRKMIAIYWA